MQLGTNMEKIADIRREYDKLSLDLESVDNDPVMAFKNWFADALATGSPDVNAFVLSTVGENNRPSSRVVLIKEITEKGLVFFTNYLSKKGHEIANNPYVSANFFWPQLERQIRIEGIVSKISEEASTEYFQSRPKDSQAGAIVSPQSAEIPDKVEMQKQMEQLISSSGDAPLTKPDHWGGYLIRLTYMELWQGRPGRLHDRICYEQQDDGQWRKFRLAP